MQMKGKMKKIAAAAAAVLMLASVAPAASAAGFGMKAENKKTTSFTLKWNALEGADAYRVYTYDVNTKKFTLYKTVKSELCAFTELSPLTSYKVKVVAVQKVDNDYQALDESGVVTVKTPETDPVAAAPAADTKKKDDTKKKKDEIKEYNTAKSDLSKAQSALSTAEKNYESARKELEKTSSGSSPEAQEKRAKIQFKCDEAELAIVLARDDVSYYTALVNRLKAQLATNGIYMK